MKFPMNPKVDKEEWELTDKALKDPDALELNRLPTLAPMFARKLSF